jgi:hypothetical protein
MLGHLAPKIETVLSEEYLFKALGLNPRAVQEVWKRFKRNPRQVGWSRPWALYVLGRWGTLNGVVL